MINGTVQDFITPEEVCEIIPGMTKGKLAQLRLIAEKGPRFYKPTPRTVLYRRSEILKWVEESVMSGTAEARLR